MTRYDPAAIEPAWQQYWADHETFRAVADDRPKFYSLCMFPYPSGKGLHVGHPLSYTAVDIVARYKRMKASRSSTPWAGRLWSACRRAAMKTGGTPGITGSHRQLHHPVTRLGFSFDWSREVSTCEPEYYRWTQWLFLALRVGSGIPGRGSGELVPCAGLVLANEEVVDGRYVETGDPVERRMMKQWMLKIRPTRSGCSTTSTTSTPEGILEMQWIGRSEGAEAVRHRRGDASFVVTPPGPTARPPTAGARHKLVIHHHHERGEVDTTSRGQEPVTTGR